MSRTAQDIFDEIVRYAATMKERSVGPRDSEQKSTICLYRRDDGNTCFIGRLIPEGITHLTNALGVPDKLANISSDVILLLTEYPEVQDFILPADLSDSSFGEAEDFLLKLQEIHDQSCYWDDTGFIAWEEMKSLALGYDLDMTVLESVQHGS